MMGSKLLEAWKQAFEELELDLLEAKALSAQFKEQNSIALKIADERDQLADKVKRLEAHMSKEPHDRDAENHYLKAKITMLERTIKHLETMLK